MENKIKAMFSDRTGPWVSSVAKRANSCYHKREEYTTGVCFSRRGHKVKAELVTICYTNRQRTIKNGKDSNRDIEEK